MTVGASTASIVVLSTSSAGEAAIRSPCSAACTPCGTGGGRLRRRAERRAGLPLATVTVGHPGRVWASSTAWRAQPELGRDGRRDAARLARTRIPARSWANGRRRAPPSTSTVTCTGPSSERPPSDSLSFRICRQYPPARLLRRRWQVFQGFQLESKQLDDSGPGDRLI